MLDDRMLHQWLSSYQYVASNITAMAIYVNIIQGTSTRGKYTHVKKTSNSENAERKQPTRNFRCWSMRLCGPAMRQLDVVKGHMYLTSGSTDCNTIYIIMIQS